MTYQEKRKDPRFECDSSREYIFRDLDRQVSGRLKNLSRRGFSFESSERYNLRDVCDFNVQTDIFDYDVSCQACVVWARDDSDSKACTYGAQILQMAPSAKTDILDVLYQDWRSQTVNTFKERKS